MDIDPKMYALAGAGLHQEKLKKQSLQILDITNQVLKSSAIKSTGHLDYFVSKLTELNEQTRDGSKLIGAGPINTLRQEISDCNQGKAVGYCPCVTCAHSRGISQRRELEVQQRREAEAKRRTEQHEAEQAERVRLSLEAQRIRDEEKQKVVDSWRKTPFGALQSLVLWLGLYIALSTYNDGVAVRTAFTMPNVIVLVFVGLLLLRAGYRVGLSKVSLLMGAVFVVSVLIVGVAHHFGASQSIVRFITPHVVINSQTFAQSIMWLLVFWFFVFCAYAGGDSKAQQEAS